MAETTADNVKNPSVIMNLANNLSLEGFVSYLVKLDDKKQNMAVELIKCALTLKFSLHLVKDAYFNRFMEN